MVYSCFACKQFQCLKVDSLILHIKLCHKSVDVYRCTTSNCLRSFTSFKSFTNHFKDKIMHSENSEFDKEISSSSSSVLSRTNFEDKSSTDSNSFYDKNKFEEVSKVVEYNPTNVELKEDVADAALLFTSKLYSSSTVTRSAVQEVVEGVTDLLEGPYVSFFENKVLNILKSNSVPDKDILDIQSCFQAISNPFDGLKTDYLRIQALKETGMYIEPKSYIIGSEYRPQKVDQTIQLRHCNVYGQHVPMKEVLSRFLQLPGALESILKNLKDLYTSKESDELITNIVQGEMWQKKIKNFGNKIVLPIVLYFDDFEPDNALGSHATQHKIGALYYSIACLPKEIISKIENIFSGLLFLSENKVFGNDKVFKPIIDDLIDLELNGIEINGQRIYFCLCAIFGDNLGLNEILGFVKGFNANHPCRICIVHKNVLRQQLFIDHSLLRNSKNYTDDVNKNNVTVTGISEICMLNRIPSYGDPTENPHLDIMHDVFEGVARYDMGEVVYYIIVVKTYIDLFTFNERIRNFDYSVTDDGNVLPTISEENLHSKNIKLSASEMLTFVRNFALMIGDYIPKDDPVWCFFLRFREIVDFITAPYVNKDMTQYLRVIISEHNEMYMSLFKQTLKPKFHNMEHIPDISLILGPLIHIESRRWESNHRPFKQAAHISNSRTNLPLTLATRYQLQQCYRFLANKPFNIDLVCGPTARSSETLHSIEEYSMFMNILPSALKQSKSTIINWVEIKGTKYERNVVIVLNFKNELPQFGVVRFIVLQDNVVYFILSLMKTIGFDNHYYSYEVKDTRQWKCCEHKDFLYYLPHKIIIAPQSGSKMITPKFKF